MIDSIRFPAVSRIVLSEDSSLKTLCAVAGGDPRTFYIGANLSDLDLSGEDLSSLNFFKANMSNSNLIGATVSKGSLKEANLFNAQLPVYLSDENNILCIPGPSYEWNISPQLDHIISESRLFRTNDPKKLYATNSYLASSINRTIKNQTLTRTLHHNREIEALNSFKPSAELDSSIIANFQKMLRNYNMKDLIKYSKNAKYFRRVNIFNIKNIEILPRNRKSGPSTSEYSFLMEIENDGGEKVTRRMSFSDAKKYIEISAIDPKDQHIIEKLQIIYLFRNKLNENGIYIFSEKAISHAIEMGNLLGGLRININHEKKRMAIFCYCMMGTQFGIGKFSISDAGSVRRTRFFHIFTPKQKRIDFIRLIENFEPLS